MPLPCLCLYSALKLLALPNYSRICCSCPSRYLHLLFYPVIYSPASASTLLPLPLRLVPLLPLPYCSCLPPLLPYCPPLLLPATSDSLIGNSLSALAFESRISVSVGSAGAWWVAAAMADGLYPSATTVRHSETFLIPQVDFSRFTPVPPLALCSSLAYLVTQLTLFLCYNLCVALFAANLSRLRTLNLECSLFRSLRTWSLG